MPTGEKSTNTQTANRKLRLRRPANGYRLFSKSNKPNPRQILPEEAFTPEGLDELMEKIANG